MLLFIGWTDKVLRANGHSPSEAFNETVEEATQSLFPLIGAHGSVLFYPVTPFQKPGANFWSYLLLTQYGLHASSLLTSGPL